ncbi:TPA: multicopper oxidase domain-containing protein, partial [Enterococcus faecium]
TLDEKKLEDLARQSINLRGMSHMVNINNKQFDMERIDLYKKLGTQEIWEVNNISSMMGGMIHPFHIHGVQFQILSRDGNQPALNEQGWKDTVLVNPDETVELLVKFDREGIFMYHCHILEHEEYGMMGQMEIK